MLTYPSQPLSPVVCPMDEDAIPPNRLCSAPPHREPPPPRHPFSSVTPSSADDGTSARQRSGGTQDVGTRIPKEQSGTDGEAAQKASRRDPSPSRGREESGSAERVSPSKQPRAESTHGDERQSEDGLDFSRAAECQNELKDQKIPWEETNVSAAGDGVTQLPDRASHSLDSAQSDMDAACGRLAFGHTVENASLPKGWVIGPFIQSFKSKMASFTEIVMSPVKLFRDHSPPPSTDRPDGEPRADETSGAERSKPRRLFHAGARCENGGLGADAEQPRPSAAGEPRTVAVTYSKVLSFDVEADECAMSTKEKNGPDAAPLRHRPSRRLVPGVVSESAGPVLAPAPPPQQPSVDGRASREPKVKMSGVKVKQRGRPPVLPRKHGGNRKEVSVRKEEPEPEVADEQLPHVNSVGSDESCDDKMQLLPSSVPPAQPDSGCGPKVDDRRLAGRSLWDALKDDASRRTPQPDSPPEPERHLAAGLGGAKRQMDLERQSKRLVKKKRATVDGFSMEVEEQASDGEASRGQGAPRKEAASTNAVADGEGRRRPARKRTNKGNGEEDTMVASNARTGSSRDPAEVCSLDKRDGGEVKPGGSGKRPKTSMVLGYPRMALETTIAIASTKRAEEERLSEALQLQGRDANKKRLKRKSPHQAGSSTESDSTAASTSSAQSAESLEIAPADARASERVQKEESRKLGPKQPSKRPRKGLGAAGKSPALSGSRGAERRVRNLHLMTKEEPPEGGGSKVSTDPGHLGMTAESDRRLSPSSSQPPQGRCEAERVRRNGTGAGDEAPPPDSGNHGGVNASGPKSGARRVNAKPRQADNQRRKCRVLRGGVGEGEEVTESVAVDDADVATAATPSSEKASSGALLRSYSCPEIPSLRPSDAPWNPPPPPHHGRLHAPHPHHFFFFSPPPPPPPPPPASHHHHAHKSPHRARRHTVCSVEVAREIAPLCLRKEVYPSRRSVPRDGLGQKLAPSTGSSLSPLATRFLSSPLAFLSKKADSRGAAAIAIASSHASSPASSSATHPLNASTWHLSGFLQRSDSSTTSSSSSGIERRQQRCEEEDDGENTSSSSQEFEDVALREEKALSDSEIKVVRKHEERGKVSSIRIRKTLPKPQNNLTPMGLPKPVRLKKKEFSLEEIYTNKNFSKAPESRLETIFEVPLNRRNGSESRFGQRRVKRFLEFLEVGEARKPKKPLVGVGRAGTSSSWSSSRRRRGGFPKDEPSVGAQDVDSLLCAKLDQLGVWLIQDQTDS